MDQLNYHHLRYFWEVANDGNLTRAATRLNVSQSALSSQIRELEARLGQQLFERSGRRLVLTEVGRIVLDHSNRIFSTGRELLETLRRARSTSSPLRVGAPSTLSRNFQIQFLRPLLGTDGSEFVLKSGSSGTLLEALASLSLDVVLTTEPPRLDAGHEFVVHRIAEQSVGLHARPARLQHATLEALLEHQPFIVPTESSIRLAFDSLAVRLDRRPRIVADVDDMAMIRLLAREGVGIAVAPAVVFADELASGALQSAPFDLQISEAFYAVTVRRNFPHPGLDKLIAPAVDDRHP